MKILLLFLAFPMLEVAVFVKVGGLIGALWTILLTIATALLGAFLVRTQGIRTLFNVKDQLAQGQMPAAIMVEGMLLLISGALLLTPGFVSDTLGFLGLMPFIRAALAKRLVEKMFVGKMNVRQGFYQSNTDSAGFQGVDRQNTIEGEYRRED